MIEGTDKNDYGFLLKTMMVLSFLGGFGVILHCIFDRKKIDWQFNVRVFAAIILILNPILILYQDLHGLLIALYLFSGMLLGIYGFTNYYNGKKIGLVYIYASLIFMVFVAAIAFALVRMYSEFIKDEIIYYRARDGWISCHLPATPIFISQEEFQIPSIFALCYLGILGLLSAIRKDRLESRLRKEGIIPREFDEIIKDRKKDNE
jgi:hypothetical protein